MKNNQVFGACGVGIGGKIAKDIRIAVFYQIKKLKYRKVIYQIHQSN